MKARLPVKRAQSNGRMAASWAGDRADASNCPEAAERGPQAASRSLIVLLGDTPCSRSSWLPPTCTPSITLLARGRTQHTKICHSTNYATTTTAQSMQSRSTQHTRVCSGASLCDAKRSWCCCGSEAFRCWSAAACWEAAWLSCHRGAGVTSWGVGGCWAWPGSDASLASSIEPCLVRESG